MAKIPVSNGTRYKRAFTDAEELDFFRACQRASVFEVARQANVTPQGGYNILRRVDRRILDRFIAGESAEKLADDLQIDRVQILFAIDRAQSRKTDLASKPTCLTR